jgi:hypothetical protein
MFGSVCNILSSVEESDGFKSKTILLNILLSENANILIFHDRRHTIRKRICIVCIPDGELVAKGLLARTQLIDAIAVGQFTPDRYFHPLHLSAGK